MPARRAVSNRPPWANWLTARRRRADSTTRSKVKPAVNLSSVPNGAARCWSSTPRCSRSPHRTRSVCCRTAAVARFTKMLVAPSATALNSQACGARRPACACRRRCHCCMRSTSTAFRPAPAHLAAPPATRPLCGLETRSRAPRRRPAGPRLRGDLARSWPDFRASWGWSGAASRARWPTTPTMPWRQAMRWPTCAGVAACRWVRRTRSRRWRGSTTCLTRHSSAA